jgi:NADH dehydrogenase
VRRGQSHVQDTGSDNASDGGIVIVGAGFAGLEAAHALGKAGLPFTLIDQHNHHLFQPLLYQVATATLQDADIAAPARALVSRYPGAKVIMDRVHDIDLETAQLVTENGMVGFDQLVLATGAQTSYFGNDHFARHAFPLKSLKDATRLRHQILTAFERAEVAEDDATRATLMTFVVVGGGPNGVGAAVAARELATRTLARDYRNVDASRARVIILEAMDNILGGMDAKLVEQARATLDRKGVEIRTGAMVEDVDASGVTAGGERIAAGTVIWTAGVEVPDLPGWLGVESDKKGRIEVGEDLTVPQHPEIFVVGDAAASYGPDGTPHPGLAALAKQQGRYVAEVITARRTGAPLPGPFRYRDYGWMVPLGRFSAIARIKGMRLSGFPAWAIWALVHVYFLMDLRRRLQVTINWLFSFIGRQRGARIIVANSETELPAPTKAARRHEKLREIRAGSRSGG